MAWESQITTALERNGVELVTYIPDSTIWPLVEETKNQDEFETYLVSREEEAVGVLSGGWLGGRPGALVCQTSGLSNTFNALGSLSKPWGLPFVGIVSRRGDLGEHNLAQVPAGYAMPELLDNIGIRNHQIDDSADVDSVVDMACKTAFQTEEPYILLLETTLTGGK